MIFDGRSLHELSLGDFLSLIDNRVPEGPHLDYKLTAYSGRASDIREMLRDVVSLANADGGYLVMGIEEDYAGRANAVAVIDEPQSKAQAIQQACLDGIQERIPGLEVIAYETGFNQGIIVLRVPPSEQRPHMMVRDHSTDFFRRYGTDKRPMTLGEIRETMLGNPLFRRVVQLELQQQGQEIVQSEEHTSEAASYIQIVTQGSVEKFLQRYMLSALNPQVLVLVSPFIGDFTGQIYGLQDLIEKINRDRTRTYVVTRPPRDQYQRTAMALLQASPSIEIRYNPDIHAKLYVCWNRDEESNFALFGSGNLTTRGLKHNLELGMMILARGHGRKLIRDLYQWSSQTLRTTSQRVKAITVAK